MANKITTKNISKKNQENKINPMSSILIDKVVINIGTGNIEENQSNAKQLLEIITNKKPANELSKTRNPSFKISKGQKIGAFVTIRNKDIKPLLTKLFDAVNFTINPKSISINSLSFGIKEYIDIPNVKYNPKIGMIGMNVNISFKRRGFRVKLRKIKNAKISKKHGIISINDIQNYLKENYNVSMAE
ncbi:MAG: 50S ribosomal protein L5 [Candidatus Micrarchaeaceae archaeon]|nr:50S ribosomal protein L5 [Candidatus Marsarchaeota archaeon]